LQSVEEVEAAAQLAGLVDANRRLNAVSDFVLLSRNQRAAIALEKRLAQLKADRRSRPEARRWLPWARYAVWAGAVLMAAVWWNAPLVQLPMNWLAPTSWLLACCHGSPNHLGSWPWIVLSVQWVPAAVDAAIDAASLRPAWMVADAAEAAASSGVMGQLGSLLKSFRGGSME
jgi:hypothetical protein